jgi:hypothetical protein
VESAGLAVQFRKKKAAAASSGNQSKGELS